MALQLFDGPPDLLPLVELLEHHRNRGLGVVDLSRFGRPPLELKRSELRPRPLLTELLRLASVGSAFLHAAADRPHVTAGDLAREFRAGDADLLVYLEGR